MSFNWRKFKPVLIKVGLSILATTILIRIIDYKQRMFYKNNIEPTIDNIKYRVRYIEYEIDGI
jgi:hypothetical protein